MNDKLKTLVIASNNQGKLKEFDSLFEDYSISVKAQSNWQVEDADETGLSFVENAIIKARHASRISGLPAVADDSGIEVFALNGQPGIYSARYAGMGASDSDNVAKLLAAMEGVDEMQRGARFYCALALVRHADDPTPVIAEGGWYGEITQQPSGANGFGYDPIFYLADKQLTAADLTREEKSKISHRAIATQMLVARLRNLRLI